MLDCVKKSAETTIGRVPTNKTTHYCQDHRIADLSQQQRQLRLRHETCSNANLQRELCNRILRQINHRLHEVACQKADQLAREIALTDESSSSHQIYQTSPTTDYSHPG